MRKPRVALALGSGGAKGLAHIGVINALHEAGCDITAVAGTSMGALIGGIHALGKLDVYADWVGALDKLDVLRLVDWTLRGPGLIKGDRIIGTVRELVGDADIETLPLPFPAVATDLERQREVWLSHGRLFDAIRASIAIPTVFHPHRVEGRLLVDGGLVNPVPVTPLLRERYDLLVAVSLDGPAQHSDTATATADTHEGSRQGFARFLQHLIGHDNNQAADAPAPTPGLLQLFGESLELMQGNLARLRLAAYRPDLLIELPRDCCAVYEFYRAREMIALGHAIAARVLEQWRQRADGNDAGDRGEHAPSPPH